MFLSPAQPSPMIFFHPLSFSSQRRRLSVICWIASDQITEGQPFIITTNALIKRGYYYQKLVCPEHLFHYMLCVFSGRVSSGRVSLWLYTTFFPILF